jgi:hypothetical protein
MQGQYLGIQEWNSYYKTESSLIYITKLKEKNNYRLVCGYREKAINDAQLHVLDVSTMRLLLRTPHS